jgi:hypothetical protein
MALPLDLSTTDWDEVAELLEGGYRRAANRSLVEILDRRRGREETGEGDQSWAPTPTSSFWAARLPRPQSVMPKVSPVDRVRRVWLGDAASN